jgi:hypothetical protein
MYRLVLYKARKGIIYIYTHAKTSGICVCVYLMYICAYVCLGNVCVYIYESVMYIIYN